jgi:dTDP-4-amino-4,6-dideoxygalactose transaminase
VFSTETWKLIATGEGGIVAADDPDLLQALRAASGDTRIPSSESNPWRGNCRMSELAATSALPQLRSLDALAERLRHLQARVANRVQRVPCVLEVLPTPGDLSRSNGSLVGVWMSTPEEARRAADQLHRRGIRHWRPSTGDLHLADNWPVTPARSEVDLASYLDIQIPVLADRHHDEFVDAVVTALADEVEEQ